MTAGAGAGVVATGCGGVEDAGLGAAPCPANLRRCSINSGVGWSCTDLDTGATGAGVGALVVGWGFTGKPPLVMTGVGFGAGGVGTGATTEAFGCLAFFFFFLGPAWTGGTATSATGPVCAGWGVLGFW